MRVCAQVHAKRNQILAAFTAHEVHKDRSVVCSKDSGSKHLSLANSRPEVWCPDGSGLGKPLLPDVDDSGPDVAAAMACSIFGLIAMVCCSHRSTCSCSGSLQAQDEVC